MHSYAYGKAHYQAPPNEPAGSGVAPGDFSDPTPFVSGPSPFVPSFGGIPDQFISEHDGSVIVLVGPTPDHHLLPPITGLPTPGSDDELHMFRYICLHLPSFPEGTIRSIVARQQAPEMDVVHLTLMVFRYPNEPRPFIPLFALVVKRMLAAFEEWWWTAVGVQLDRSAPEMKKQALHRLFHNLTLPDLRTRWIYALLRLLGNIPELWAFTVTAAQTSNSWTFNAQGIPLAAQQPTVDFNMTDTTATPFSAGHPTTYRPPPAAEASQPQPTLTWGHATLPAGYPPSTPGQPAGYPPSMPAGYPPPMPGVAQQPAGYPPSMPAGYPPPMPGVQQQPAGYPPPMPGVQQQPAGYPPPMLGVQQQPAGYPPPMPGVQQQPAGYPPPMPGVQQQPAGYPPPMPGVRQQPAGYPPPMPGGLQQSQVVVHHRQPTHSAIQAVSVQDGSASMFQQSSFAHPSAATGDRSGFPSSTAVPVMPTLYANAPPAVQDPARSVVYRKVHGSGSLRSVGTTSISSRSSKAHRMHIPRPLAQPKAPNFETILRLQQMRLLQMECERDKIKLLVELFYRSLYTELSRYFTRSQLCRIYRIPIPKAPELIEQLVLRITNRLAGELVFLLNYGS
ncbi:hypothetical protein LXA43DRAFT_1091782 [Ganoderma leucocontextum]|nr:hypothetical protein LXA43DRAFT_1063648 [Ganoderma leucocontextum]KAI1794732.1 hypothetical protein LXA43DRAFT_1091782 [Ganoderma leucocontextum]